MCFLDLDVCLFHQVKEVSGVMCLNQLSAPFSLSPLSGTSAYIGPLEVYCKSFFFSFFFFSSLERMNSTALFSSLLELSSTSSSLLLSPSTGFFSSDIVFVSSMISVWRFLIFSLCCSYHFVHVWFSGPQRASLWP